MITKRTTFVLQTSEDDLFAVIASPSPAPLARITCVVCQKPVSIPIDAPARLCGLCGSNPAATADHVQKVHEVTVRRFTEAWQGFDVVLANAPTWAQERWGKVEAARRAAADSDEALVRFQTAWEQRKAEGGAFADLLATYEGVQQVADECNRVFEWSQWAALEVEAAQAEVN